MQKLTAIPKRQRMLYDTFRALERRIHPDDLPRTARALAKRNGIPYKDFVSFIVQIDELVAALPTKKGKGCKKCREKHGQ